MIRSFFLSVVVALMAFGPLALSVSYAQSNIPLPPPPPPRPSTGGGNTNNPPLPSPPRPLPGAPNNNGGAGGQNGGVQAGSFVNPLNFGTLPAFLNAILDAVILIAFPILVLFLVYSGFLFISAQGNPAKLADARKIFIWTLIGALLVLGAKALSLAIEATVAELQL